MWDSTNQERANAEGWRLVTTFNNGDTHPLWDIATHGPRYKTDRDASLGVIAMARKGSPFHQSAMKLVADSRIRTPQKAKR